MDENGGGAGQIVRALGTGDRVEADIFAVVCDPDKQSGPRRVEVPLFVAPGNGEHTGVYWCPVYAVLEGHFDLIVGNARHIRNVPGRKTDVKDAEWIADLVRHGLIAKSFVPPKPLRELREMLRYRRKLVESQAAERNRLLKLLETANIKLASVASDVF